MGTVIGARYFGALSLVPLKCPGEGFKAEVGELEEVEKEHSFVTKNLQLGQGQIDLFSSGLGLGQASYIDVQSGFHDSHKCITGVGYITIFWWKLLLGPSLLSVYCPYKQF